MFMTKKYTKVFGCLFLTLLSLSSCSYPSYDWGGCGCDHARKRKNNSFGFVPLYTEEELNQAFSQSSFDSKEEQFYQASNPVVSFHNITFATDSYTIKGEDNLTVLSSIVHYLQKNPKIMLYIEGHTDERGAASYNLALGSRRANSVKQHLVRLGIPAERLFTVSYGKEQPIHPGHNELAWQQNRRTAFRIHAK